MIVHAITNMYHFCNTGIFKIENYNQIIWIASCLYVNLDLHTMDSNILEHLIGLNKQ